MFSLHQTIPMDIDESSLVHVDRDESFFSKSLLIGMGKMDNFFYQVFLLFLAISQNEIMAILTLSISEGSEWGWSRFSF